MAETKRKIATSFAKPRATESRESKMVPANCRQFRKLPLNSPLLLQKIFGEVGCRIVIGKETALSEIDPHIKAHLNIGPGNALFDCSSYPLINTALCLARKMNSSNCSIVFKCYGQKNHVQQLVKNFLAEYPTIQPHLSVVEQKPLDQNIVDFLINHAMDYSVKLLSEQTYSGDEPPGRLSKVMNSMVDILDWESSYKNYGTSVKLQPTNKTGLFSTLGHILKRQCILNPMVIQTPIFDAKVKYRHKNLLTNSPYEIYQYCRRVPDVELENVLTCLTTYSLEAKKSILQKHKANPQEFYGQIKLAENLLKIVKGGDKSLLEDCIEASRHLFYKKERKSLSGQGIKSIKNVCHSATIPYKPSIPFHVLCELFTNALPAHIAPRFDAFVEEILADGTLTCNGQPINLDHKFSPTNILADTTLLASKNTAFVVKWETGTFPIPST